MYWLLPDRSDNGVADLQHWLVLGLQRSDLNQLRELLYWFEHTVRANYVAITKMSLQMTTFSVSMTLHVFAGNPILSQLYEHAATHGGSHIMLRKQLTVLPASVDPTAGQLVDYLCPQSRNPTFEIKQLSGLSGLSGLPGADPYRQPVDGDPPYFSCSVYIHGNHHVVTSECIPAVLLSDAIQGRMGHV